MISKLSDVSTIILDRDGVINVETGDFVKSVGEWQVLPGSYEAIAALSKRGYRIFVATNQSGIARGLYCVQTLTAIHKLMLEGVSQAGGKIDGVFYCPHVDDDHCDCRKPKPGLLFQIATKHKLDLSHAVMVGDSARDVQAALEAGAHAVFIGANTAKRKGFVDIFGAQSSSIAVYSSLAEFADQLLSESTQC